MNESPPSIWAVWRGFNSDSVLRKLFSGDMDFRKTETNLILDFVRAEEGSGEESARASFGFFWRLSNQNETVNNFSWHNLIIFKYNLSVFFFLK
ncbi:MAG: hypothetical protein UX17_C0017G0004 [Parcubacteria group bacterium GW2011_GWC2_45_7]|nr:MAG: hypothetical protein UX17_C0017G0004 [Parcubacteria group bacterium GW2011_GWC2_45_7]KKU73629.1 MAG: hypothetical protein UX98_C0005G0005 [Parcubacteria group bacterium GW2011_GWA2_47_26]